MPDFRPIDPSAAGAQHGKRETRLRHRPRGVTRLDSATPEAGGTTLKQLMHGSRGRPFANLIDFGVFGVTVLVVALISRAWNDHGVKESPAPVGSPAGQASGSHSERAFSPSGWGASAPRQAIEPSRPGAGSRSQAGTSLTGTAPFVLGDQARQAGRPVAVPAGNPSGQAAQGENRGRGRVPVTRRTV